MSKQNEILATIETFLKDRNGEIFKYPWNQIYARIYRRTLLS